MTKAARSRSVGIGLLLAVCLFLCGLPSVEGAGSSPLADALKAHLLKMFPWPEIEISDLSLSEPVTNATPSRIVVEKNPPGKIPFVAELGDGKRITGTVFVRAYDRVVVSVRANRKGHTVQDGDVYVALMDVTRIPKGSQKDPQDVVGKTLTRAVAANVPVVDVMVTERTVVKRGHRVTLLAESPGFNITTYGELKSQSVVGSPVKVLNLQSKKVVGGLLIDENTVKVEF